MKEMVGGCCVCSDERGWTENPLVYCDGQGCTVAVHQACYGIVTVPTGPWFCRKCESQERAVRVRCELCPIRDGALKRTDNQAWAHVVCALYIPEVRFGNVTTMEPIILQLIPAERYNKSCYICEEQGKGSRATVGACMQCNKAGCKAQFHVTCAQGLGLLCEEAGNYMDNVKYCGYCQHHYSKLKKGGNVKHVPPYKPVANEMAGEGDKEESGRKRKGGSGGSGGKAGGRGGRGNTTPSPNLNKPGGVSPSTVSESGESSHLNLLSGNSGANGTLPNKELLPPPTPTSAAAASVIKDPVLGGNQSSTPQNHGTKFTTSNFVETVVTPSESVFGADQAGPKSANNPTSNPSSGKKRRSAGGIRTPPGTAASELLDSSSNALAAGTSGNVGSSVTKMDVDQSPSSQNAPIYPPSDITSVEKGVKKLKVVSEPNLSALASSPGSTLSLASVDPVAKFYANIMMELGNSAPATQSSSTVTSSANSIVVSVPLTAAVSLPSSQGQTSAMPSVTLATSHGTNTTQSSSTETTHYISSSNGTTTTFTKAPVPSLPHDVNSASKRSRSQSAEKQDKRKTKRGAATLSSTLSSTTSTSTTTVTSPTMSTATSSATLAQSVTLTGSSGSTIPAPSVVNTAPPSSITPSASAVLAATAWPNKRGRVSAPNPATPPPPPQVVTPDNTTSSSLSKDSPPSSPEPTGPTGPRGRRKSQKNHQSSSSASSNSSVSQSTAAVPAQPVYKEERDVKLFQNGVTSVNAPHMLGNQLNPASSMAQKMSDTLSAELEAHSIFTSDSTGSSTQLIGPPLPSRVISSVRSSSTHSAESGSGSTGSITNKTNNNATVPQTLDQLLERQWEQGSQFLMEQAQHFDIASLLTCLHQLRSENTRLEEHIRKLQQRRDHLLAVNARLAIPLTSQTAAIPAGPQSAASANAVVSASGQIPAQVPGHMESPSALAGAVNAVPALSMHVPAQVAAVSNPVPAPGAPVQRTTPATRPGYQAPLENGLPNDPNSHHSNYSQSHQRNPIERSHQSSAIRHAQPTGASYIMSQQTGSSNQGVGVVRSNQAPPEPGRRPGVGYVLYPPVPGGSVTPGSQFNLSSQQVVMRRNIH